jgi:hypothetical protein
LRARKARRPCFPSAELSTSKPYLLSTVRMPREMSWSSSITSTRAFMARQVSALYPAADLFSPGWSLLVLLAWPAAGLAVAAVVITRRDA